MLGYSSSLPISAFESCQDHRAIFQVGGLCASMRRPGSFSAEACDRRTWSERWALRLEEIFEVDWTYLHGRLICPVGIQLVLVAVFVIQAVCETARSWKPSALFAHEVAADMFIGVESSSGRCR